MTRRKIQEPKSMTLGQYIISKVRELEKQNPILGTINDGIWQESVKGEPWDTIRVGSVWNAKYITIDELVKEHKFCEEQFENRMMAIGVY